MRYFIFLCFLLLNNCSHTTHSPYIPARYVVIAQTIRNELSEDLSDQYNMRVIGTVGGLAEYVNLLGLKFQIKGPLTQAQLRIILLGCVNAFLTALNNNEEIRPYLKTYPFTAEGINIGIFVMDSQGKGVSDPNIGIAQAFCGTLDYITIDRKNGHQNTVSETYEEAMQIVGYR